jgi:Bacterial extracellular solute-binding protein
LADLAKDGINVITANPKTSGVAKWNFLALWNSAVKAGDESKAQEFVKKVYKNAPILHKDAREATDIFFKQGQGDALINYENEIILAQQKGEKVVLSDTGIGGGQVLRRESGSVADVLKEGQSGDLGEDSFAQIDRGWVHIRIFRKAEMLERSINLILGSD